MSTSKAITDLSEMEFLTEAPALQECPAPAVAKPGIAELLMMSGAGGADGHATDCERS